MDFITRLPKSEGKDAIFVVIDQLTKYAYFRGTQAATKVLNLMVYLMFIMLS